MVKYKFLSCIHFDWETENFNYFLWNFKLLRIPKMAPITNTATFIFATASFIFHIHPHSLTLFSLMPSGALPYKLITCRVSPDFVHANFCIRIQEVSSWTSLSQTEYKKSLFAVLTVQYIDLT